MGFLNKLKGTAKTAVDQHGDKIAGGIDKAAAMADKKTKGKYTEHIGTGVTKAQDGLDKLDGKNDDIADGTGGTPRP